MWIYSLGITLRRAVHTFSTGTNQQATGTTVEAPYNDANVKNPSNNKNPTSLERVIRAMCAPNIYYRASLMYLLDVSSILCVTLLIVHYEFFIKSIYTTGISPHSLSLSVPIVVYSLEYSLYLWWAFWVLVTNKLLLFVVRGNFPRSSQ